MKELIDLTIFNHQIYMLPEFTDLFMIAIPFFILALMIVFFRGLR